MVPRHVFLFFVPTVPYHTVAPSNSSEVGGHAQQPLAGYGGSPAAHAAFDIAGINVSLGDVLIDAEALNNGKRGDGALANADLMPAHAFQTFAMNSLNLQAHASSHGIGGARAAAIAALTDAAESGIGGFDIPGGIALDAAALTFSRAQENASALASLAMVGLPGTGIKTGPIDVEALASDRGAAHALAAALAALDFSSGIDIESLTVQAREVDR